MRNLAMIILLALLNGVALAWNEPEDFRGIKWGTSEAETIASFPRARKMSIRDYGPHVTSYYSNSEMIGETPCNLGFNFLDGKFAYVSIGFKSEDFHKVESAFRERYGEPTIVQDAEMSNRMGAKFTNRIYGWRGANVSVRLSRFSSTVVDGSASIGLNDFASIVSAHMKEQRRKGAKDL